MKETKNEHREELSQATKREKSSGNVANLVQRMSTIGIPTGGFLPQPPPAAKSKCFYMVGLKRLLSFHGYMKITNKLLSYHCLISHGIFALISF